MNPRLRSRIVVPIAGLTGALLLSVVLVYFSPAAFGAGCVTWIGGSGDFGSASNWSTGAVPTSNDDVCIDATTTTNPAAAADTYTVTIDNAYYTVNSLTLGGPAGHQAVVIAALNVGLSVNNASSINGNGELDLGSGAGGFAMLAGPATVTNAGSLVTVGGDPRIEVNFVNASGGGVDIARSTRFDANTTFTQSGGSLTVEANQDLHLSGGSAFDNLAGTTTNNGEIDVSQGTFVQRAGTVANHFVTMGGGPGSTLDDDTGAAAAGFFFTNEAGYSSLTGTGASPGVAAGQTVVVQNNNMELDLGTNLVNAGTIYDSDSSVGGYARLGPASATLTNTGHLYTGNLSALRVNVDNQTGGSVEALYSTAVDSATTFTNDGGAVTVDANMNLHLSGGSAFDNLSGTVTNNGELEVSQGTFVQRAGTVASHFITMGGGPGSTLDDDTSAGAAGFYFTNETGYASLTGTGSSPGVASGQTIVIQNNNMELDLGSDIADHGAIQVSDQSVGGYANLNNASHVLSVVPSGGTVTVGGLGTYIQGASGTLGVTVDATHGANTAITGSSGSTADLDGTLQVSTLGSPPLNSTWTVVNVSRVNGTFPLQSFGNVNYSVSYPPGQVVLTTPGLSSTTSQPSMTTGPITAVPAAGVAAGTTVYDEATVTGNSPTQTPTGSVTFYVCAPATPQVVCSNTTGSLLGSSTLSGSGAAATTFSSGQVVNTAGTWCFAAYYQGDNTFPTSGDATSDECFSVSPAAQAFSQLDPTNTTCPAFMASPTPANVVGPISYSLKAGKISSVNPGVFYYYSEFSASAGGTADFLQSNAGGSRWPNFLPSNGTVVLYDASCNVLSNGKYKVSTITVGSNTNVQQIAIPVPKTAPGSLFIVGIKFSTSSVVGTPAAGAPSVAYTFSTAVSGNTESSAQLTLQKK